MMIFIVYVSNQSFNPDMQMKISFNKTEREFEIVVYGKTKSYCTSPNFNNS